MIATPRVIGLDLSLTGTGVASSLGHVDTITSKGKSDATLEDRQLRISGLAYQIARRVKGDTDLVVIEAPAFSRTTGHMHDRSGLWWLTVDRLLDSGYPVAEVTATQRAKYATGKGNASKDAVLAAVVRRYPDVEVSNNNEADALVLAAMGARWLGHPIDDLPKAHLAAMDAVRWPIDYHRECDYCGQETGHSRRCGNPERLHEQGDVVDDGSDSDPWITELDASIARHPAGKARR